MKKYAPPHRLYTCREWMLYSICSPMRHRPSLRLVRRTQKRVRSIVYLREVGVPAPHGDEMPGLAGNIGLAALKEKADAAIRPLFPFRVVTIGDSPAGNPAPALSIERSARGPPRVHLANVRKYRTGSSRRIIGIIEVVQSS